MRILEKPLRPDSPTMHNDFNGGKQQSIESKLDDARPRKDTRQGPNRWLMGTRRRNPQITPSQNCARNQKFRTCHVQMKLCTLLLRQLPQMQPHPMEKRSNTHCPTPWTHNFPNVQSPHKIIFWNPFQSRPWLTLLLFSKDGHKDPQCKGSQEIRNNAN